MKVNEFYDSISGEYTDLLDRAVPRYREMLASIIDYIPSNLKIERILELGCGTGNLTELIIQKYPHAEVVAVDISGQIIKECRQRLQSEAVEYLQKDFMEISFEPSTFDLVLSSIAIHHLKDEDKRILFSRLNTFIRSGGVFIYADQSRGVTEEIYQKNIQKWKTEATKLGSSNSDWETWMKHQDEHDYHALAIDQIKWLETSSFKNIDIVWRNLLWTIFYAEK